MPHIHPTAVVSPDADLSSGVVVGPYVIIEENVKIGEDTVILAHSVIKSLVKIGANCTIGEHAVLGGAPQDSGFAGEESYLNIADNVTIREFASLHRATGEGESTIVSKNSYVMAYVHISHNCKLGENVTVANATQLGGYVEVGAQAFIGGATGVHQFVRIGKLAMVGAHSYLTQDIPPFLLGSGHPFRVSGINRVGLERAGILPDRRRLISRLFHLLYRDPRPFTQAIADLSQTERSQPEVAQFLEFINSSKRGVRLKSDKLKLTD